MDLINSATWCPKSVHVRAKKGQIHTDWYKLAGFEFPLYIKQSLYLSGVSGSFLIGFVVSRSNPTELRARIFLPDYDLT